MPRSTAQPRKGSAPLLGGALRRVLVILDGDLIRRLDRYGRRNDMPSRSAVLRRAARELLEREAESA